jgi:hypothetical protein
VPVHSHAVVVSGPAGTLELRAADPARALGPSLFATLIRAVPREPRDVCFGVYAANESPVDGDVACQVRGHDPLLSIMGATAIPGHIRGSFATYLLGQAPTDVTRVTLIGPDGAQALPLSSHRLFLARFASAARGQVRVVATLADGHELTRIFSLPASVSQANDRRSRYRRPGAVFNDEVGANILRQSYRQIVRRFGLPLKTSTRPSGERCAYYDVVGYPTGWLFCFKRGAMASAGGNQAPPPGVH